MDNTITTGKERTVFFQYLIPSMLSMLAVSAYSFVDTYVVGQGIGAQAVAAMGVGTPVVSILYALGFLLGAGGAVNYSVARGSGDSAKARSIFSVSFAGGLLLWIVIAACGNLWIDALADFLGATPGNHQLAVEYLRWIFSLSGVLILDLILNNFMRNEGHPNVSMIATVTGTTLNIGLDFLFVLGFDWGMGGAASATCMASVVSVLINLIYAISRRTNLIPGLPRRALRQLGSILRVGFGSFVLEGAVAVISVVFLNFAGKHFGDDGVSAFSVLITLNLVVYSLLNGVAQAVQPLVSANYAVHERGRIRRFVRYGLLVSAGLGLLFFAAGELLSLPLANLFVADSAEISAMAAYGLRCYAPAFLFMSVSILLGIYFQSEVRALPSLIILLGRSAVFPIVMLYVLDAAGLGSGSLWMAIPIGEGIAMLTAIALYLAERRKQ